MTPAAERLLADAAAIAAAEDRMAAELAEALAGQRPVLVGIRTGGDVLAARLAERLRARGIEPLEVGVLDVTLYRDDFGHRRHWPEVHATRIQRSLEGETVVLVDDVLFTGRTIRAALEALLSFGRPERVLAAVLVDRGDRQLPICADVVGMRVSLPRDRLCLVRFQEQGHSTDSVVTVAEAEDAGA